MNEEQFRVILSTLAAHETIIAALLRLSFDPEFTVEEVEQFGEAIKANANETAGYTGLAKSEAQAEQLADVVVQMQQHVARVVDTAVQAFVTVKARQP